jgi:hypothetical protein
MSYADGYCYWPVDYSIIPSAADGVLLTKSSKTEGARAVVDASWQVPATATQLHKVNQGAHASAADLVEQQIVGIRNGASIDLYKIDFVSKHRPDHDLHDRVDMLVLSGLISKEVRTLTYWTDFDAELILPKTAASSRLFVEDLLKPKVVVVGGDAVAQQNSTVIVASTAKHSWPAVKKDQDDLVRMEATEDGEWKFWSIWKNGPRVYYHHGRIGEPSGNEGVYVGSSVRAGGGADTFMQRKIAEKVRKGYVKV